MSGRMKPGTVAGGRVSGQCAVEQPTHPLYSAVVLSRNARPSPPRGSLVLAVGYGLGSAIASSVRRASDPPSTLYVGPPKAKTTSARPRPPQGGKTAAGRRVSGERKPGPPRPLDSLFPRNDRARDIAKMDPPFRDHSGRTHQRGCVQSNDPAGVGRDG
jgi:hypothetical protein